MTRNTATTLTVLCLLSLSACTGQRPKPLPPPEIKALTTPAPRPTKKIDELRTERDEQDFIIESNAAMAKDEGTFQRLRELLEGEPTWWEKIKRYFGGPAGGGE